MDLIRKIPKKFTKKFGNKVINRQYFRRKTGLYILIRNFLCPDQDCIEELGRATASACMIDDDFGSSDEVKIFKGPEFMF